MKYRAVITIEFDADDQLELVGKKREISALIAEVPQHCYGVEARFSERRPRLSPRAPAPSGIWDASAPAE